MVDSDFYTLLEVERTADDKAIKASYRRLAMECHPDRHGGCTDKEARFKAISEAYDCLKDPQKRAAYDRFGHAAFQNGGAGAGGFGGGAEGSRASPTFSRRSSASSPIRARSEPMRRAALTCAMTSSWGWRKRSPGSRRR